MDSEADCCPDLAVAAFRRYLTEDRFDSQGYGIYTANRLKREALNELTEGVDGLTEKVDNIWNKIDDLSERVTRLENNLATFHAEVNTLIDTMGPSYFSDYPCVPPPGDRTHPRLPSIVSDQTIIPATISSSAFCFPIIPPENRIDISKFAIQLIRTRKESQ